jgi:hypothetical protein
LWYISKFIKLMHPPSCDVVIKLVKINLKAEQ